MLCVLFYVFVCIMYVVVWHANDGININTWMAGWLYGRAAVKCKLNVANVFVVDWNGTML